MGISKEFLYKSLWTAVKLTPVAVTLFYVSPIIIPVIKIALVWLPFSLSLYRLRFWLPSFYAIKVATGSVFALFKVKSFINA